MTVNSTGTKGFPLSGFDFDLQNAIAQRGGFKFQYVLVDDPGPTESFTHWLTSLVSNADIVATDWYSDTIARRNVGLGFTEELVDASLVLVTTQSTAKGGGMDFWSLWNFLYPFAPKLWGTLAALVFVNALLMFFFTGSDDTTLFKNIYMSFSTFCQAEVSDLSQPLTLFLLKCCHRY